MQPNRIQSKLQLLDARPVVHATTFIAHNGRAPHRYHCEGCALQMESFSETNPSRIQPRVAIGAGHFGFELWMTCAEWNCLRNHRTTTDAVG